MQHRQADAADSPENEREAPGFRHGEESGCDFSRLELKSIATAIFFVNRFAIFMTNSCYSSLHCGDVERTGCTAKNSSHIGTDFLACGDCCADDIASLKTEMNLLSRLVTNWEAKLISAAHLSRTVSCCLD